MPNTNLLIASTTLSSTTTQVDFSSLSQNYNHLRCVLMTRSGSGSSIDDIRIRFNDSTSSYSRLSIESYTGFQTLRQRSYNADNKIGYTTASLVSSNTFGLAEIWIPNYSSTDKIKTSIITSSTQYNGTDRNAIVDTTGSLWNSTAAINKISFLLGSSWFEPGSTFYIYGITNS